MTAPNDKPTTPNLGSLAGQGVSVDAKGYVQNLQLADSDPNGYGDILEFFFRPGPVSQRSRANYEKMRALGMSHSYQSYSGTENNEVSFEVYFHRLMMVKELTRGEARGAKEGSEGELEAVSGMIEESRRWLESLLLPPALDDGRIAEAPPACILCLPNVVTMRCRLMSLDWTFSQVDVYGRIVELRGAVTFEEAPISRVSMQDALEVGMFRA